MTRHPSTEGRSVFCCLHLQQGSATSTLEISSLIAFTAVWEKEHRYRTDWKEKWQGQRKDKTHLLSQLTSEVGSQQFFLRILKRNKISLLAEFKVPIVDLHCKAPQTKWHIEMRSEKAEKTICKTTQKKSVQTLQLHWLTVFTRCSGRRKWKLTSALHCLFFFEIIAYIMVKYRKFSILIKNLFRGCLKSRAIRPWNRTERVLQKYSISASDCPGGKKKERKKET